jgi:antitoxin HicB
MRYPVDLKKDGKFILVTFPDVPEAITQGNDEEDALVHARDVLESAIEYYLGEKKAVPVPKRRIKPGQHFVELPIGLSAKVLLLNEMLAQKVRPAELARRMKVRPQDITRLTDLRYGSKIEGLAAAFQALGKTLELRAV